MAASWGIPGEQVAACLANLDVLQQLAEAKRAALGLALLEIQVLLAPSKLGLRRQLRFGECTARAGQCEPCSPAAVAQLCVISSAQGSHQLLGQIKKCCRPASQ